MARYSSIHAVLGGIVDYAGTFPPASLTFEKAVERAATFRREAAHPWLLGRVVFSLTDLKKISPALLINSGASGETWNFTVLGSSVLGADPDEFYRTVEWDLREIRSWAERNSSGSVRADVLGYETKIPSAVFDSGTTAKVFDFLAPVLDRCNELTHGRVTPYLEFPWDGPWLGNLDLFSRAIEQWAEASEIEFMPGIKIRTGGNYVPTPQQISAVLAKCVGQGLRFKATQGLHHAISREGATGFVNLFAAVALAYTLGLESFNEESMSECISDRSANAFKFGADTFVWKKFSAESIAIENARRIHLAAFGSCSADEPDQFLKEELGV